MNVLTQMCPHLYNGRIIITLQQNILNYKKKRKTTSAVVFQALLTLQPPLIPSSEFGVR